MASSAPARRRRRRADYPSNLLDDLSRNPEAPVHIDEAGRLVIDTRLSWPQISHAREAVERYLYTKAMQATGGNAAAAGRLLGQSSFQMFSLGRYLTGSAPRPSRAAKS